MKLLVVEDETVTRKNLIKHVKWSELGVDVVEEARDGIEGLEAARQLEPDIVVSDIRMPGMNGIDFTFHVRKQFPDCRIIYLSGYSDKEYLKAAIRINAVSYVEKPINIDEFQDAVKKAVDLCKEQYRIKSESLPFIHNRIVNGLIHKNMDREELERNLNLAGISLDRYSAYTASIIVPSYEQNVSDDEKQRCCEHIVDRLHHASGHFAHLAVIDNMNRIVVLSAHQPENRKEFAAAYRSISEHLKETRSPCSTLSWIAGNSVSAWEEISGSYRTAVQFLNNLFFYDSGGLYYAHNRTGTVYRMPDDILASFSELLKELEENKIMMFIEKCARDIQPHTGTPVDEVKNVFYQMMRMISEEGRKRGLTFRLSSHQQEEYDWAMMSRIETLRELKECVQKKTRSLLEQIAKIESNSSAVLEVKKYIHRHCSNKEITVNLLADHVCLSPTYLSSLFKKETGKTISEYLTEVRIEKSAELLKQPQVKLYEVADRSGYYDANYFSKAFKKIKGMTPSQFRRKYKS